MRGTHENLDAFMDRLRIIPADAGNTLRRESVPHSSMDHPRGCGEHAATLVQRMGRQGSSPRMRGTLLCVRSAGLRSGIIPADAGNTGPAMPRCTVGRDHPRGCGEHKRRNSLKEKVSGSSPRMRGTPLPSFRRCNHRRIIPADAGNTAPEMRVKWVPKDHPRGCGEHLPCMSTSTVVSAGSSPRMRGTRIGIIQDLQIVGIIPADAGNTIFKCRLAGLSQDHPRGCGEHILISGRMASLKGSSPRMRGTRIP